MKIHCSRNLQWEKCRRCKHVSWWHTYLKDWCLLQWQHILVNDGMYAGSCFNASPSQQTPDLIFLGLDRSGLMLSGFPHPLPLQSRVYSQPANRVSVRSSSVPCSILYYNAALTAMYFCALASFFTLHRTATEEITQHLRKEIWLEHSGTKV